MSNQEKNVSERQYVEPDFFSQVVPENLENLDLDAESNERSQKDIHQEKLSQQDTEKLNQINEKLSEQHEKQKLQQVVYPKLSWETLKQQQQKQQIDQPSYIPDKSQKLITDYCSNTNTWKKSNKIIQKHEHSNFQQYQIIIKPAKQQQDNIDSSLSAKVSEGFYKNNDIYGVAKEIQQNQVKENNKWEIEENQPKQDIKQDNSIEKTDNNAQNQQEKQETVLKQRNLSTVVEINSSMRYKNEQVWQNHTLQIEKHQVKILTVSELDENVSENMTKQQIITLKVEQIKNIVEIVEIKSNQNVEKDQESIKNVIQNQQEEQLKVIKHPEMKKIQQQEQNEQPQPQNEKEKQIFQIKSQKQQKMKKLSQSIKPIDDPLFNVGSKRTQTRYKKQSTMKKPIRINITKLQKSKSKASKIKFKQQQFDEKQKQKINQTPTGSVYHFEIINSKKGKKSIIPVRRSSRLFQLSKSKHLHQESQNQNEQKNEQKDQNSLNKSQIDSKSQNRSKSKHNKTKSKNKRNITQSKSRKSEYFPRSKSKRKQQTNQEIDIDWLKDHLNQVILDNKGKVYLYEDYKAMTQKDKEISQLIMQIQSKLSDGKQDDKQQIKQEKIQTKSKSTKRKPKTKNKNIIVPQTQPQDRQNIQKNQNQVIQQVDFQNHQEQNQVDYQNNQNQQNKQFSTEQDFVKNKHKYRISEQFPLTIQRVIEPDIEGKGIYALVELGRLSQFFLGTKYAVTPITSFKFVKRRDVTFTLKRSQQLVPQQYKQNIAYVPLNSNLKELIQKQSILRSSKKNDQKQYQI